jgi:amyloid beta A4 protein
VLDQEQTQLYSTKSWSLKSVMIVLQVMKDWSDLEERYQDMRTNDPKGADEFKKRMTQRFQKTVQALEEEGDAEKHQLVAMHQQRVMAHINERKKEAMGCYTQALSDNPPNVSYQFTVLCLIH